MLCPRVISHQYLSIYTFIYTYLSLLHTSIIRSFTIICLSIYDNNFAG